MSKRYKWISGETYCDSDQMYDNETGNKTQPVYVADLLNEQDKRIKELESEVKVGEFWHSAYQGKQLEYDMVYAELRQSYDEIEKLKQRLHDLPEKIVEEIKENFDWRQCCEIRKYYDQQYIWFNYVTFNDFLETILKKYGGEDESNND